MIIPPSKDIKTINLYVLLESIAVPEGSPPKQTVLEYHRNPKMLALNKVIAPMVTTIIIHSSYLYNIHQMKKQHHTYNLNVSVLCTYLNGDNSRWKSKSPCKLFDLM